jgi:hypothetical protein
MVEGPGTLPNNSRYSRNRGTMYRLYKIKSWFIQFKNIFLKFFKYPFIRVVVVVVPPILITLCIFPYPQKITLNKECGNNIGTTISYNDIVGPSYRKTLSEIFQAPLGLQWYDIYFHYNVKFQQNFTPPKPWLVVMRLNSPHMLIPSKGTIPIPQDFVPNMGSDFQNQYLLSSKKDEKFYYSGQGAFSCSSLAVADPETPNPLLNNLQQFEVDRAQSILTIYAKANIWAWSATLFLVLLAWSAIVLVVRELCEFIYGKD